MVYLKKLILPSERAEDAVIMSERRTCFNGFYPFKLFPAKELKALEFEGVTMLYGGNGSGKSTLINVIARKINAIRYSEFNSSPFFDKYVDLSSIEWARRPGACSVLTSDDVFDYSLSARAINENIDEKRNDLFDRYVQTYGEAIKNPELGILKGLDDYERWREVRDIISPRKSQSDYVRERTARDIDLFSNGETAMRYFVDRIESDGLYLLDEPENSLSIERQIELCEYIAATALATKSQFVIATHSPVFLSMKNAKIYDLDSYPVAVRRWTELPNVRKYFDFFMEHKEKF